MKQSDKLRYVAHVLGGAISKKYRQQHYCYDTPKYVVHVLGGAVSKTCRQTSSREQKSPTPYIDSIAVSSCHCKGSLVFLFRDSTIVPKQQIQHQQHQLRHNGAGDLWGTTVRNKDKEFKTLWESTVWGITRGGCETYLVTLTDRCSFLCVSGQRGTIAKSLYEEHLCVVVLTSIERGTQFFPLVSFFLV